MPSPWRCGASGPGDVGAPSLGDVGARSPRHLRRRCCWAVVLLVVRPLLSGVKLCPPRQLVFACLGYWLRRLMFYYEQQATGTTFTAGNRCFIYSRQPVLHLQQATCTTFTAGNSRFSYWQQTTEYFIYSRQPRIQLQAAGNSSFIYRQQIIY